MTEQQGTQLSKMIGNLKREARARDGATTPIVFDQFQRDLLLGVTSATAGVVNSAARDEADRLWGAVEELRALINESIAISREIAGKIS